jgi:hypothetical protein
MVKRARLFAPRSFVTTASLVLAFLISAVGCTLASDPDRIEPQSDRPHRACRKTSAGGPGNLAR